jgi:hypothetical protein
VEVNPSNTELNPICHLLALLGAHHILHVSRIRVKFVFEKDQNFFNTVTFLKGFHYTTNIMAETPPPLAAKRKGKRGYFSVLFCNGSC